MNRDTPEWLYNSYKYKSGTDEIPEDSDIPDKLEIRNLRDLIMILDICKEWNYNNESRKYPIEVYTYCYLEKEEAMKLSKEEYPEIYETMRGEGREPIEIYRPFIAMSSASKSKVHCKTLEWIDQVVPLELNFYAENDSIIHEDKFESIFTVNIGNLKHDIKFEFFFNKENIEYDWYELKSTLLDLKDNFMENIRFYKILEERKLQLEKSRIESDFIDEYRTAVETLKELRNKFKTSYRDKSFDFFIEPNELFSFNKTKNITENINLPNILIYRFISEFCNFIFLTEYFA